MYYNKVREAYSRYIRPEVNVPLMLYIDAMDQCTISDVMAVMSIFKNVPDLKWQLLSIYVCGPHNLPHVGKSRGLKVLMFIDRLISRC